jgi:TetR/AcrR family tetracycline transcriptional repressor
VVRPVPETPPPAPAPAQRLSREILVDAGIELLCSEGLDAISLRKIAARLGVRAPSLYWHVPDKATLLADMMEKIFAQSLASVPALRHWPAWMRAFGEALWHTQDGVRDFARLLVTTTLDETRIARTELRLRAAMAELDLPLEEALRIQGSVQVLVTGWSIFAHTPFSPALSRRMDFRARAMHDLDLLLAGEARQLAQRGAPAPQSSGATTS